MERRAHRCASHHQPGGADWILKTGRNDFSRHILIARVLIKRSVSFHALFPRVKFSNESLITSEILSFLPPVFLHFHSDEYFIARSGFSNFFLSIDNSSTIQFVQHSLSRDTFSRAFGHSFLVETPFHRFKENKKRTMARSDPVIIALEKNPRNRDNWTGRVRQLFS